MNLMLRQILIILTFGMSLTSEKKNMNLKGLSCDKNIILQKANKGDSVILINMADYVKGTKQLLSETYVGKFN